MRVWWKDPIMDGLFVCMYVCMYLCVCVCIYYIYIYIYKTHICVYVCVYVCICINVYMYLCMCICMYIYYFLCCCCVCLCCCCTCFGTMNLTSFLPPLYVDTPDTRRNIWYPRGNAKPHEHRNNPRAYIPIKTHIHTTFKKRPLPTKPMQIFIPQIHD